MATILDAFTKEDRVEVTFSDFYRLMRESTKSELIMNAVNCDVPHMYIREMATGNSEAESAGNETAEDTSGDDRGRSIEP